MRGADGDKPAPTADIYAGVDDNERRRYREQYPQEATTMAGMFQRAREESKQQGIEQGIEQGRGRCCVGCWGGVSASCRPTQKNASTGRRRATSSAGPRTCSTPARSTRCSTRTTSEAPPQTDEP